MKKSIIRTCLRSMQNKKAESYVGNGLKILIAVVLGALLLSGLYVLFNNTIMPTAQNKVESLFNYAGTSGGSNGTGAEQEPTIYPVLASNTDADHGGVFMVTDMSLDQIVKCTMDGERIASPEIFVYEIGIGGIRADFSDEYTASLSSGNHVFRIEAEDGYAEVILTKS